MTDGFAPDFDRTAQGRLKDFLVCAQKNWLLASDGPEDTRREAILHTLNYFSAAWLLRALMQTDPAKAEDTIRKMLAILDGAEAVGEWIWDLLNEIGIDPQTIQAQSPDSTGVIQPVPDQGLTVQWGAQCISQQCVHGDDEAVFHVRDNRADVEQYIDQPGPGAFELVCRTWSDWKRVTS